MKRLRMMGLAMARPSVPCRPTRRSSRARSRRSRKPAHHDRLPRLLDSVLLSRRQPEADRLCDRHLPQHRRCREAELKLDKLTVEFNPVTSSTRIPLLANGTIDLECGSTTNNADRLKQVSFTNTHFLTATRFVSKKASKLNSIDDLKGKSVASTSGTTNIKQLTEANAARSSASTSSRPRNMPNRS
jgi:ABC-type amino acid transport/signal transduction systems, periplasmic component/domain